MAAIAGRVGVVALRAVREQLAVRAVQGEAAAQPDGQRVELVLQPSHSDKCRSGGPRVRAIDRCPGRARPR